MDRRVRRDDGDVEVLVDQETAGNRTRVGRRGAPVRRGRAGEAETCDAAGDGGAAAEELRARDPAVLAKGPP